MVSTTNIPTIRTLQTIIAPSIKPFNSSDYFKTNEGQSQISAQIQQSRNIVGASGGMKSQSTLPQAVLIKSVVDLNKSIKSVEPIFYPTPTGQIKQSSTKNIKGNIPVIQLPKSIEKSIIPSTNVIPTQVDIPSSWDIMTTKTTADLQDLGENIKGALGEGFKSLFPYVLMGIAVYAFASKD